MEKEGIAEPGSSGSEGSSDHAGVLRRSRRSTEDGFTLVEVVVATTVLTVVMSALGPLFYGAMKLTGLTNQRSQATNLAVAAIEQLRSLPYTEVGYYTTPAGCTGANPVTLTASGPLDSLPGTEVEGHTTYDVLRCVYWSASSIPGSTGAYKQTVVKVSWQAPAGLQTVSQVSALYPGGYAPPSEYAAAPGPLSALQVCTAATSGSSPTDTIDVSWTPPVGYSPTDYVVYYTAYSPTGAITTDGEGYAAIQVNSTSTAVTVGSGTTYYFQVVAVIGDTYSPPSPTCSAATQPAPAPTYTTYSSQASSSAVNLSLGGASTPYTVTSPADTVTNDGSGSNAPVQVQPAVAVPGADSFLSVTAATEWAEANTDGSSYSCSGLISTGQTLSGGGTAGPCALSGTASGGISLNLAGLPGVGAAISTLVSGLVLNLSGATSWATASAGSATLTGSASLTGATVTVTPVGGLVPPQTLSLTLPPTLTSPTDLISVIAAAINADSALGTLGSSLQAALDPVLTLTGAYQSTSGGQISVSALHIVVLSGAGTGDLALSTAGANTEQTTTLAMPCSVNTLVVTPSQGPGGGGVALTASGTLADESSFQLAVNASSGCSNVEVGYAPTGCLPGSSGCPTNYAPMTGPAGSGTLYGSAGTASTVWQVGNGTFTVFTGSTPVAYSPLNQQQVTLCTEKGDTGQC